MEKITLITGEQSGTDAAVFEFVTQHGLEVRKSSTIEKSDAVLILSSGMVSGKARLIKEAAEQNGIPVLVMEFIRHHKVNIIQEWIAKIQPQTLHITGPNEETCPGIFEATKNLLTSIFSKN